MAKKKSRQRQQKNKGRPALQHPREGLSLPAMIRAEADVLVILLGLILVAYFNAFGNAFVSDDVAGMARMQASNPTLGETLSQRLWLHALPIWLVYKLFGLKPFFFRLINLSFHLGTVWVFYLLVERLLSSLGTGGTGAKTNPSAKVTAILAAIIFAIHPLLSESVVWISASAYPQYTFFGLLALLFYLLAEPPQKYFRWYLASLLSFLAAVFSSEKAIFLPIIFLLYEISFGSVKKHWNKLSGYFVVGGGLAIYYLTQIGSRVTQLTLENYTDPGTESVFLKIPIAVTEYLKLFFWPYQLTLYHSELAMGQGEFVVRVLVLIGLLGLIGFAYKKNKFVFFWLALFVISLTPTLTPWRIGWVVAERYVYFGTLGLAATAGFVLNKLFKYQKLRSFGYTLISVLVLLMMWRTILRNIDWHNEDNLWIATGKTSPSDPKTHNNLGDVYGRHGNLEKSAEEFKKAIALQPNYADAYHNLANTYRQMGRIEEAIQNYQKALELRPYLWQSHQQLAAIYFDQGKYELALEETGQALEINPKNSNLYVNLAVVYLKMENVAAAKENLAQALRLDPQNPRAQQLFQQIVSGITPESAAEP